MRKTIIKKLLWFAFYSLPLIAFLANLTEPRAEAISPHGTLQRTENYSPPLKVIYKRRSTNPDRESWGAERALTRQGNRPTVQAIRAYVQSRAMEHGVNPKLALWIVKHESAFNPQAKGDGDASRGLWQISKIFHPEVSDAAAFNVASSTEWSLERIRAGKVNEWSTYRFCRTLYQDCPF